MKLTAFILLACGLHVSAKSVSQTITLSGNHLKLEKVLAVIKKQTGFSALYDEEVLKTAKPVTVAVRGQALDQFLYTIFRDQPLTYIVENTSIIIVRDTGPAGINKSRTGPPNLPPINGSVTDEAGAPVQNISIVIKGSSTGTTTDAGGNFAIDVPLGSILIISGIGFETREVVVEDTAPLLVRLKALVTGLDEIVVVGYGTQIKANLTGAVSTVDMEKVKDRPVSTLSESLQGAVPGLTVTRNGGGNPGSSGNILIRGYSSVRSAGPLVIVDGLPGSIDNINPDDVASISVLKDATSTAIYGARAAEGVILITTKSGTFNQSTQVSYQTNVSLQTPGRYPAQNNSTDNAVLGNLAFTNSGGAPLYSQDQMENYVKPDVTAYPNANNTDYIYTADMDWQELLFKNSLKHSHQLAISGGSQHISYRVSGNLLIHNGMFSDVGPDRFSRKTLRANLAAQLIPSKLTMDMGVDYFNSKDEAPAPGYDYMMQAIRTMGPTMPVYNPDGTYARYRQQQNPVQILKEAGYDRSSVDQLRARMNVEWKVTKELSMRALGGYTMGYTNQKAWHRAYAKYVPTGIANMGYINQPNSIAQENGRSAYSMAQLVLDYKKDIGKDHHIDFLVGGSTEEQKNTSLSASRDNIPGNELDALNIGSNANWRNNATEGHWKILSGFSRLNYDYKKRYLLEMNVRMDGSSRFSTQHRWGTFPSMSAAWRISNESFMSDQRIFSDLKIRASWGKTGNQSGLGLYDYIPVYNVGGYYPFGGGQLGQWAVSPQLASLERTWETVTVKNIGINMGFLNNRLSVSFDYFQKKNSDMLVNIQVPSIIGTTVPTGNYGVLETKGWELLVDWKDRLSSGFRYSVAFNISDQTNKLIDFATPFANPTAGMINLQGYPLFSLFGYQAAGYFQTPEEVDKWATQNRAVNAPGDIKYIDQNSDDKISAPGDLVYMGNNFPRFTYGVNLGLSFRDIDFSAFIQGVGKRDYYLDATATGSFLNSWDNFSFNIHNDYWTPENPNALFPRPFMGSHNYQYSTHWLQNASYMRLKNIQIGYSFPARFAEKIGADRARIYFSGEDIFTHTKLIMYDPEINSTNGQVYPVPQNFSLGLNLTF